MWAPGTQVKGLAFEKGVNKTDQMQVEQCNGETRKFEIRVSIFSEACSKNTYMLMPISESASRGAKPSRANLKLQPTPVFPTRP